MKSFYLTLLSIVALFFLSLPIIASEEETLIIFDASVSMLGNFQGQPKYLTAINEAKSVLDTMPSSKLIGLRTIGISIDGALAAFLQNPDELCKATKLTAPIRANNIEYIKTSLDNILPLGTTPLTYSLNLAINYDFTRSAELKHIILVTDGGESCNGDPCKYIRDLMQTRKDIKIDIIAIGVSGEDFAQLKCLTDSTFGNIINVTKPSELKPAFNNFLSPSFKYEKTPKKEQILYKNYLIEVNE